MPDPTNPAPPKHSTDVVENFFWTDGSGFCFDLPPMDVIHGWGSYISGDTYDIPEHTPVTPGEFTGWTNWLDKYQFDYRFAALSDYNAKAHLFPEVQDPWMFTEYVYRGLGRSSDLDDAKTLNIGIVHPPLYYPNRAHRVFEGTTLKTSAPVAVDAKPATRMNHEEVAHYGYEYKWKSKATNQTFWERELDAKGWMEKVGSATNISFERLSEKRRVVRLTAPALNSGVRLYHQPVWVESLRWGHSQNVPARTVTNLGVKDWFEPPSRTTDRLVPHVQIIAGQPIFDISPQVGGAGYVEYHNVEMGLWQVGQKITEKPVNAGGTPGRPEEVWTYSASGQAVEAKLPTISGTGKGQPAMKWKLVQYTSGDMVHRGCDFWEGKSGQARCTLYANNPEQWQALSSDQMTFTAGMIMSAIDLPHPVAQGSEKLVITFYKDGATAGTNLDQTGLTLEKVVVDNNITRVTIKNGTSPLVPTVYFSASTSVKVKFERYRTDHPYPDHNKCTLYDADAKDKKKAYTDNGGKCPHYQPHGPRILATYEAVASNGAEWANLENGLPAGTKKHPASTAAGQFYLSQYGNPMGGGAVSAVARSLYAAVDTPDPYTAGIQKDDYTIAQVTFEPEVVNIAGKQVYYDTPDGRPPKNAKETEGLQRVRAGTGFNTLDLRSNAPMPGVDTPFFGFVNQINYRVMSNIMQCYRPTKCDKIIRTPQLTDRGFIRGRYSDVDFSTHPLKMKGFPGYDARSSDSKPYNYCHYGNHRCPSLNLDRRAVEFDENYKILLQEILWPFRTNGVYAFSGVREYVIRGGTMSPTVNSWTDGEDAMFCAVYDSISDPPPIGHYHPEAAAFNRRIVFYYDIPSWETNHRRARVFAHIIQFDDQSQPCYMTFPSEHAANIKAIYGDEKKVPWIVELLDDYSSPSGNLIHATNSKPMAGGRNPQYRDHSKRGRQVICYLGNVVDTFGATGATFTNQFGGPPFNRAPASSMGRMGYWVDRYGEFIVDETPIPSPLPSGDYVGIRPRIRNDIAHEGGAIPIDGEPGTTLLSNLDPTQNRNSEYARVGHTYSNDTPEQISWFHEVTGTGEDAMSNWDRGLPIDPLTGKRVAVAAPFPNSDMLPLARHQYRCNKCGIRFTEEEVNFLKDLRNDDDSLKYPLPPSVSGVMGCPRGDGGGIYDAGRWDRFLTSKARGEVEVWAPPGTTVRHDGYFWKNPTLISRAHEDQLLQKLGKYTKGGGYDLGHLTPDLEKVGRMPVAGPGHEYQLGLLRQLVAPWAAPGESVKNVRERVAQWFGLDGKHVCYVTRDKGRSQLRIEDEQGFTLQAGDLIDFWREDGNQLAKVGVTIGAITRLPDVVLQDNTVLHDTPMPPTDKPEELREWLQAAVLNSYDRFSSSINVATNALAAALVVKGLSPELAEGLDPKTGASISRDERLLSPYTKTEDGGMKMITLQSLKRLRNRVLPMLAYDISADHEYTAGGDYTRRAQLDNEYRFNVATRKLPMNQYGKIAPQVLAATSTGKDYYVEWEIGDVAGTTVRAYYPVGSTWWRMKQKVGQIKRGGGTNPLHLDDSKQDYDIPYTGDVITSVCAYFLHGRVPMDKELVKAYVVYQTEDGPYADAIGCQGKYTGMVGHRNEISGNIENAIYVGHDACFWQHYHPFTTNHEQEIGAYKDGGELLGPLMFSGGYWGAKSKWHWEHHNTDEMPKDDPAIPTTLGEHPQFNTIVPQVGFLENLDYHPFLGGTAEANYKSRVEALNTSFVDTSYGFKFEQSFFEPWEWGQDLKQLVTEHQAWKDITYAKYDQIIDRYQVPAKASLGNFAVTHNFQYYGADFRNVLMPHETQGIPGWLNMSYFGNGLMSRMLQIEKKKADTSWASGPQVIVQAEANTQFPVSKTGGQGYNQTGNVARVIDATDHLRQVYNDRVDRVYKAKLGKQFNELFELAKSKTDTNFGHVRRFHEDAEGNGDYQPLYPWNYRYMRSSYGIWLNDPWHHPPTNNGGFPEISENGDPLEQTLEDRHSRVWEVSSWDTQGLGQNDPNYMQHHPLSLLTVDIDFTDSDWETGGDGSKRPSPLQLDTRYWRVVDTKPSSHWFTMSLLQVPYETMRRNWRLQAPSVNSSNAVCWNKPSCFVAEKGWTVGQFYEATQASWASGGVPSIRSDRCGNCGVKMTEKDGVIYLDGDGITTVAYDPLHVQDVVLSAIDISTVATDGKFTGLKHGFSVEYFNTQVGAWRQLFSVDYNATLQKYTFLEWNGSSWHLREVTTLPSIFKGSEAVSGHPRVAGSHFAVVTASQIRFRVSQPYEQAFRTPFVNVTTNGGGIQISKSTVQSIDPVPNRTATDIASRRLVFKNPDTNATVTISITQAREEDGNFIVTPETSPPSGYTTVAVDWTYYVSRCNRFRVYGYPFYDGEVTITPPGFVQPIYFSGGNSTFQLNAWPTQIIRVDCAMADGRYLQMTEVPAPEDGETPTNFNWTVVKDRYQQQDYLKVTAGKWYYDWRRNLIVVPLTYLDPDSGDARSIVALNSELYNDPNSTFNIPSVPNRLVVEYFNGAGVPITVEIEAAGEGPSYQLEPESICYHTSSGESVDLPESLQNPTPLPDMGESVPLKTNSGGRFQLNWLVYNHDPVVWEPQIPWIIGSEMPASGWDDATVLGLFTGGRGDKVSDLGPGAYLGGTAKGKVTFYGTPNTFLSGKVGVFAKAVTRRSYHSESGDVVTTYERTGGFKSGAFVFRLEIDQEVPNGRKGVMCGVPRVLLYFRERNLTDPL